MLRVDFYLLSQTTADACWLATCRLSQKVLQTSQRLFIQAENAADAQSCDEWLWTFKAESFLPHHCLGDGAFVDAPILIGLTPPAQADGVLLNLSTRQPKGLAQFSRVLEVISNQEAHKQQGRSRWRYYQQQGFFLEKHDL